MIDDEGARTDSGEGEAAEGRTRIHFPATLPLLPIRDLCVFPYMMAPLLVSREITIRAVDAALDGPMAAAAATGAASPPDNLIFLAAQNVPTDEPAPDDIHAVGTIGMIVKVRKLSDGRVKVLCQGLTRARITGYDTTTPYLRVSYERLADGVDAPVRSPLETEALLRTARDRLERYAASGKVVSQELQLVVASATEPGRLGDLIAGSLALKVGEAQPLLAELRPHARLEAVSTLLAREMELRDVRARIETRAREELSKSQREVFLREQIRAIRTELGEADGKGVEIDELRARIVAAGLSPDAARAADKELGRLEQMHGESAEAQVVRAYLDWLIELPWGVAPPDAVDLGKAKQILDHDHYDLRHVKDRILEYLGVRKLRPDGKGPILCLVGPPGVGKTSLGRSIARALGRTFVRISLGGVRDEAEVRGHRRTYVGALPGRILQGMKQAGVKNPVFMLDEIDKLGNELRGDPASALLEVLDPEQNGAFRDHYLGLPFDLSQVLFLATANHDGAIPPALRDRMEILRLAGYSVVDKLHIARRHVIPRQLEAAGLGPTELTISPRALRTIVVEYTREAGLRELERQIARLARKRARRIAERGRDRTLHVTARRLPRMLGAPPYARDAWTVGDGDAIGVATGLAWTPYGGEVLHVEAQAMPGKGTLTLTGQLGDVMRESAQTALSCARARAARLGVAEDVFGDREIHIHVPAGAVPKDGPSAGVTMATALVSLFGGTAIRRDVAMTGEITLRGRVLPVGGLKEKLLAAARSPSVKTVIIPAGNLRELDDLPKTQARHLRARLEIVGAATLDDVMGVALVAAETVGKPSSRKSARGG